MLSPEHIMLEIGLGANQMPCKIMEIKSNNDYL